MRTAYNNSDPYLHQGAYVSRLLSGVGSCCTRERGRGGLAVRGSAFDSAAEAAFELAQSPELLELWQVVLAAEGGQHAGEIADRGD